MALRTLSTCLSVSILTSLLLAGAPVQARVGDGTGIAQNESDRVGLQTERRKLAADLERANRDIEQLKQKDRGVRDDYRLRARMADAEAIARRLTEVEAHLGTNSVRSTAPRPIDAPLQQTSTDGPTELEAKADILTDQSRRLATQAEVLGRRLGSIKDRQELRRRAGQLESDPFAPLEGSKRRVISSIATGASAGPKPVATDSAAPTGTPNAPRAGGAESTQTAPRSPDPMGAAPGLTTPPTIGEAGTISTGTNKGLAPTSLGTPAPMAPSGGAATAGDHGAALSTQLRDLLDANSLAAIRKLELAGTTGANLEALERAAAALRERAQLLQAQSDALRARARGGR